MKIFCTERLLVVGAFLWSEAPAAADWLEIVQGAISLLP